MSNEISNNSINGGIAFCTGGYSAAIDTVRRIIRRRIAAAARPGMAAVIYLPYFIGVHRGIGAAGFSAFCTYAGVSTGDGVFFFIDAFGAVGALMPVAEFIVIN